MVVPDTAEGLLREIKGLYVNTISKGEIARMDPQAVALIQQFVAARCGTSAVSDVEALNGVIGQLCNSCTDLIDKLDRYSKRQGKRRLAGEALGDGTVPNPNANSHYPSVQSAIDQARHQMERAVNVRLLQVLKPVKNNTGASNG